MSKITVHNGDCLDVLASLPECSIDAVVTDPPYELGFMGKSWDASGVAFSPDTWRQVMRVLKPGGHMVAFGAPKNYHRLACAIEDAGFEIRDSLMWVFGVGFPKSLDVSKAIDKAAGADREVVGVRTDGRGRSSQKIDNHGAGDTGIGHADGSKQVYEETAPATDEAKQWQGWGSALKPAYEPIVLARKPLSEGTVAANVLRWGTGAINIDATRIGMMTAAEVARSGTSTKADGWGMKPKSWKDEGREPQGRWPANFCHDGSQEVVDLFPQSKSTGGQASLGAFRNGDVYGKGRDERENRDPGYGDEGSAARFFYCAKANKHDRAGSKHPTVKPVALMQWLIRMVTPPGGTILDPFAGSGTTGQAAIAEAVAAILIEREKEYYDDIMRRIA